MNAFSWPFVNASIFAFDCATKIWIFNINTIKLDYIKSRSVNIFVVIALLLSEQIFDVIFSVIDNLSSALSLLPIDRLQEMQTINIQPENT